MEPQLRQTPTLDKKAQRQHFEAHPEIVAERIALEKAKYNTEHPHPYLEGLIKAIKESPIQTAAGIGGAILLGYYGSKKGGNVVTGLYGLSGFLLSMAIADIIIHRGHYDGFAGMAPSIALIAGTGIVSITAVGNHFLSKKR